MSVIIIKFSDKIEYEILKSQIINIPYFRAIFENKFIESDDNIINIHHVSDGFEPIYKYYTLGSISSNICINDDIARQCEYFQTIELLDEITYRTPLKKLHVMNYINDYEFILLYFKRLNLLDDNIFDSFDDYCDVTTKIISGGYVDHTKFVNKKICLSKIILSNIDLYNMYIKSDYKIIEYESHILNIFNMDNDCIMLWLKYEFKKGFKNITLINQIINKLDQIYLVYILCYTDIDKQIIKYIFEHYDIDTIINTQFNMIFEPQNYGIYLTDSQKNRIIKNYNMYNYTYFSRCGINYIQCYVYYININVKRLLCSIISSYNSYDNTMLMYYVIHNNNNYIDILLDNPNIDINIQNSKGHTALMLSVFLERWDIFSKLINDPKIDVNLKDKKGMNVLDIFMDYILHLDTSYNKYLKIILEKDISDISFKNMKDNEYRDIDDESLSLIINDPRFNDSIVDIPKITFNTNYDIFTKISKLFIEKNKFYLNDRSTKNGCTLLMNAICNNNNELMIFLLKQSKIDLRIKDDDGNTSCYYIDKKKDNKKLYKNYMIYSNELEYIEDDQIGYCIIM
jgi:hypothetical protein